MLTIKTLWEYMPGLEAESNVAIRNFGGSTESKVIWFCLAPVDANGKFAVGQDVVVEMPAEVYEQFAGSQSGMVLGAIQSLPATSYNGKKLDFSQGKIEEFSPKEGG